MTASSDGADEAGENTSGAAAVVTALQVRPLQTVPSPADAKPGFSDAESTEVLRSVTRRPPPVTTRKPKAKPDAPAVPRPIPLDQSDRYEMMAIIRDVFSTTGAEEIFTRDVAKREIARALGYERVGARINEVLDNDIRTAVRRGILENSGGGLRLLGRSIHQYTRDHLIDMCLSDLPSGWCERDDIIVGTAPLPGLSPHRLGHPQGAQERPQRRHPPRPAGVRGDAGGRFAEGDG